MLLVQQLDQFCTDSEKAMGGIVRDTLYGARKLLDRNPVVFASLVSSLILCFKAMNMFLIGFCLLPQTLGCVGFGFFVFREPIR